MDDYQPAKQASRPVQHLFSYIRKKHGDKTVDSIFRKHNLENKDLYEQEVGEYRFIAIAEALEEICQSVNDIDLALEAGLEYHSGSGLSFYIAKHAKNLRQALELIAKYRVKSFDVIVQDVRKSDTVMTGILQSRNYPFLRLPRMSEFFIGSVSSMLRYLTNKDVSLKSATFIHLRRPFAPELQKRLACEVTFDHPEFTYSVSNEVADTPTVSWDRYLLDLLIKLAELQAEEAQHNPDTIIYQTEMAIVRLYDGAIPNANAVARHLHLSERTLSRRLREENSTYSQVVLKARIDFAKRALRDTDLPVSVISSKVGYSEPSAFTNAFKKATGASPKQYREKIRS